MHIRLLLIALLLLGLQACELESVDATGSAESQTNKIIHKSAATKGAGIKLLVDSPESIEEGIESAITLNFYLNANEILSLKLVANDALSFLSGGELVDGENVDGELANIELINNKHKLQSGADGLARYRLSFIPHQMGKFYLKIFTAVEREGQMIPQIFSVPIYVGDDTGMATIHKKENSKQVTLPASRY